MAVSSGEGKAAPDRRAASQRAGEQGLLFDGDDAARARGSAGAAGASGASPALDDVGYRGPMACSAAGITYRQLDYWARTKLVEPSIRAAQGSGSQRLYSFTDILVLKVVKRLLDTGVSLQQIRTAVANLRDRGVQDLARITLMSDGVSVYECTSPDEVVDLVQGGQGVFGIALGRVWQDVEGTLAELPAERAHSAALDEPGGAAAAEAAETTGAAETGGVSGASGAAEARASGRMRDELAHRRTARKTG